VAKAKTDIVAIDNACTEYLTQNQGKYPESLQELVTPDEFGMTFLKKEKVPADPWGNEYQYEPPSGGVPYPTITSFGSDGVPGGEADARDITNHMIRNDEI
jgi:type II secretory pathway pseudopilin PulG